MKLKSTFALVMALTVCAAFTGCSGAANTPAAAATAAAVATAAPTPEATSAPQATATPTPAPRSPLLLNDTGKTLITRLTTFKRNDISTFIISKAGTVVACDPMLVPAGVVPDLYVVTHDHHIDSLAESKFKDVRHSVKTVESFTVKDVKVTGIAASHSSTPVSADHPDIVIYVFDVDGLRIAFFACVGQEKLTDAQMAALGNVDVALVTIPASNDMVKQIKAKMIIPLSHNTSIFGDECAALAKALGTTAVKTDAPFAVDRASLDAAASTQVVQLIKPALK